MKLITVMKNNTMPGNNYLLSYKDGNNCATNLNAGDAGNAAAFAVTMLMRHPGSKIIACEEVSKLIPEGI